MLFHGQFGPGVFSAPGVDSVNVLQTKITFRTFGFLGCFVALLSVCGINVNN